MKILVVGGGVAGTAFASFMQNDAEITLIDKTPKWGDIGYGIALWGNGRKILRALGAEHDVLKDAYEMPWSVFEDNKGNVLKQFTFDIFRSYGETIVITRTHLHKAIINTLGNKVKINLGVTVDKIFHEENGATVVFSDGKKEFFDLVVGADGIHSQIRDLVFGKEYFKYYGYNVWAFWSPAGFNSPQGSVEVITGGKMYFVYPMGDRAIIMLATNSSISIPEEGEERRKKLHELFSGFKNSVGNLINAIEEPGKIFHDSLAYVDMSIWNKGRVILIGDAQHASSPITGMGASMALEDSYVLAEELKTGNEIGQSLKKFIARRNKRIKKFQKTSNLVESWMMVKSPFVANLRNLFLHLVPMRYFTKSIERLLKEEI